MTADAAPGAIAADYGLIFLTYAQLIDASASAILSQGLRFTDFENAADAAYLAARDGDADRLTEAKATMAGCLSGWRAQTALVEAIAEEITIRVRRGDYA